VVGVGSTRRRRSVERKNGQRTRMIMDLCVFCGRKDGGWVVCERDSLKARRVVEKEKGGGVLA